MKDNRKIIQVLTILTIIFTIMGGSLAYWTWQSDSSTKVTFSVGSNFSCSVDGGGNINQTSANEYIAPATCTNEDYAIKRKVVVTPSITKNDLTISMDLWLDIDNLGTGLSDSYNFKYVLSTSESSCEGTNIVNSGTFHGKATGDTVVLLDRKTFTGTAATSQTYWLYIWLDKYETSTSTMNQSFSFSLNGSCTDNPGNVPNAPVLDDAMIPVTIADNGDVTTVSETDPTWYDYENKEWANVVLVKEEGINNRQYYLDNQNQPVEEEDILAYYVWIPRYKYRIPSRVDKVTMCGELENPTMEKYPECYGGPFSMSNEDKSKFQEYLDTEFSCIGYVMNSLDDILATGIIKKTDSSEEEFYEISLISVVNEYNSYEDEEICNCNCFTKEGDITLKGGTLLGDKIYTHEQSTTPVSIDISFEDKTDSMVKGDAIETYYSHPGFWRDDNEDGNVDSGETLSGIWVGKFEMAIEDLAPPESYTECSQFTYEILPNQTTSSPEGLTFACDGEMYFNPTNYIEKISLNSESLDVHEVRNSEWGAIAYLTHSKYGTNSNVEKNNTMITGGGTYGTLRAYPQSTTGNITGIFDMAGGNQEITGIYKDSCYGTDCYGQASFETKNWYNNQFLYSDESLSNQIDATCHRTELFGVLCRTYFEIEPEEYSGAPRVVLVNKFTK